MITPLQAYALAVFAFPSSEVGLLPKGKKAMSVGYAWEFWFQRHRKSLEPVCNDILLIRIWICNVLISL